MGSKKKAAKLAKERQRHRARRIARGRAALESAVAASAERCVFDPEAVLAWIEGRGPEPDVADTAPEPLFRGFVVCPLFVGIGGVPRLITDERYVLTAKKYVETFGLREFWDDFATVLQDSKDLLAAWPPKGKTTTVLSAPEPVMVLPEPTVKAPASIGNQSLRKLTLAVRRGAVIHPLVMGLGRTIRGSIPRELWLRAVIMQSESFDHDYVVNEAGVGFVQTLVDVLFLLRSAFGSPDNPPTKPWFLRADADNDDDEPGSPNWLDGGATARRLLDVEDDLERRELLEKRNLKEWLREETGRA